jgi:hypothetical protein
MTAFNVLRMRVRQGREAMPWLSNFWPVTADPGIPASAKNAQRR